MRNLLMYALSICSLLSIGAFMNFAIAGVKNIIRVKRGLEPIKRDKIFNGSRDPVNISFRVVVILGAAFIIILLFFTNTTIGSIFEKSNYTEEYYVLKYPSSDDIDCTKMRAVIRRSYGEYYLVGIYYGSALQQNVEMWDDLEIGYRVEAEVNGETCYIELLQEKVPD